MGARSLRTAVLFLLLLGGCAFARTGEDRFSYTPSASVEEADFDQCDLQARAAAHRAVADVSDGAETFALLTGGLGAWLTLEYASSVEQKAYTEAFETCLRDKGYLEDASFAAEREAKRTGLQKDAGDSAAKASIRRQWRSRCQRALGGDGSASSAVASHFQHGWQPAPKDLVKAYLWYTSASDQGYAEAVSYRKVLENEMTPVQISEAEKLAEKWAPDPAECEIKTAMTSD